MSVSRKHQFLREDLEEQREQGVIGSIIFSESTWNGSRDHRAQGALVRESLRKNGIQEKLQLKWKLFKSRWSRVKKEEKKIIKKITEQQEWPEERESIWDNCILNATGFCDKMPIFFVFLFWSQFWLSRYRHYF